MNWSRVIGNITAVVGWSRLRQGKTHAQKPLAEIIALHPAAGPRITVPRQRTGRHEAVSTTIERRMQGK